MSGGSFNYAYSTVDEFVYQLEKFIGENKESEYQYSKEVIKKFEQIIKESERLALLMKEVEWRVSEDTGDDNFLENVKEIEKSCKRG